MLTARSISKSYGQHVVLDQIDLELHRGQIVGLLGRNGAGKSTLLKILASINRPDHGHVQLEGSVGFLSEKNPLYPNMYVLEYLKWVANVLALERHGEQIDWVISNVGLEEVTHKKISQLSKGFKQRLGLATSLLSDPDVLILDEPINGLDPVQISEYRNVIRALAKNKVIILSSHLLQEIEALCDRILLIRDGKIVEDVLVDPDGQEKESRYTLQLNREMDPLVLLNIEGIDSVRQKGQCSFLITVSPGMDIIEQLFDTIVEEGCKIMELTKVQKSLQELFEQ